MIMMEKKDKEYYAKCAREIDKHLYGLFDDCEDLRAALVVIEVAAVKATGLFTQAVDEFPVEKKEKVKMQYLRDIIKILAKGDEMFMEKNMKKEGKE